MFAKRISTTEHDRLPVVFWETAMAECMEKAILPHQVGSRAIFLWREAKRKGKARDYAYATRKLIKRSK